MLRALIDDGEELEDAVEDIENGDVEFYPNTDLTGLAEQFVDEGFFDKDFLLQHIDFEAIGRELEIDGYLISGLQWLAVNKPIIITFVFIIIRRHADPVEKFFQLIFRKGQSKTFTARSVCGILNKNIGFSVNQANHFPSILYSD